MNNTYFVTGTDTEVGKTLVTTALLHSIVAQGKRAFGLKPIAAGCQETKDGRRNEDAVAIQRHSNVPLSYEQINPLALLAPKAPHIAAAEEGRKLSLDRLEGLVRGALMQRADLRLVEGAGGWRIPLNSAEQFAQLPQRLDVPVILVVGVRLGCINHALLSAEAIRRDGLSLRGWVANVVDPHMASVAENIQTLKDCLGSPCLGEIPWLEGPTAESASVFLDGSSLL